MRTLYNILSYVYIVSLKQYLYFINNRGTISSYVARFEIKVGIGTRLALNEIFSVDRFLNPLVCRLLGKLSRNRTREIRRRRRKKLSRSRLNFGNMRIGIHILVCILLRIYVVIIYRVRRKTNSSLYIYIEKYIYAEGNASLKKNIQNLLRSEVGGRARVCNYYMTGRIIIITLCNVTVDGGDNDCE